MNQGRADRGSANGAYDLVIIGGGINGAGIARDAAGRGLKVLLAEKGDLAEGTSSRSGKLVHGGLRYLEYYEFRLVREALIEREVLLAAAPHIIRPMRFVLPHAPNQRPAILIRIGLFLYDHLGGRRTLPGSRRLDLAHAPEGAPIRDDFHVGFEYADCWVDDARLVVLNALDAAARGAQVLTRTKVARARREDGAWRVALRAEDGAEREVTARILANAAGPWVEQVLNEVVGENARRHVRLVKGSHIVVRKFWEGPQAYILQNDDRRVIFVVPYQEDLCLIGTTDIPFAAAPEEAAIEETERRYLLGVVNRYMRRVLTERDIVYEYSGVRPLYDDEASNPSAVTRDYVLDLEGGAGRPPLLSVFGGKITTYRKLAEHALAKLKPFCPGLAGPWTAHEKLPGGDIPGGEPEKFAGALARQFPELPGQLLALYARQYGTRAAALLDGARTVSDLGRHFGGLLFEREARFLRRTEWARTEEDVLTRRTAHHLSLSPAERERFAAWFAKMG
ncbi:MAG TPA: glycerol-3-phosphate dehydrogenase [Acetobacteraceae bacterium]|nr:glycerol-3-phosphate dehydrogenase [Acetobacteraceae bacterium]